MQKGRILLIVLLLLASAGCGRPAFLTARHGEFPLFEDAPLPEDVTSFIALYEQNCQACHGALVKPGSNYDQLTADEKKADGRFGPAPPLNDPMFLAIVSDDDLRKVMSDGRHGSLMPAFALAGVPVAKDGVRGGPLTADQVNILIKGIRGRWGKKVEGPLPAYRAPAAASGNIDAGKKVFEVACATCHTGTHTLKDHNLLELLSDQTLRRLIITGRPDLKTKSGSTMPDFRTATDRGIGFKPLTEQDIADLMALLTSWRTPPTR